MRTIALTGHPEAQDAVGLQLTALSTQGAVRFKVLIGVSTREEAYAVHAEGGEIWHCGPYKPASALVGLIDRVLTGTTFDEIAPHVASALAEMLSKKSLTGEPA